MYDALIIVQLGSGQLSHGTAKGTQARFDALLNCCTFDAKLMWSSPKIQTKMGAKDVLFQIDDLNSCLHDTLAYYSEMELIKGFTMTCAFEPRVIKQSCGSEGEGIWLCWQWDKASTTKVAIVPITQYIEGSLDDGNYLRLMEMSDNHVGFHAVRECITFCIRDYDASGASVWTSSIADKYLEGGKALGSKLINQRLPPRIDKATHVASTLRCRGGGGEPTHTKPYCEDIEWVSFARGRYCLVSRLSSDARARSAAHSSACRRCCRVLDDAKRAPRAPCARACALSDAAVRGILRLACASLCPWVSRPCICVCVHAAQAHRQRHSRRRGAADRHQLARNGRAAQPNR